MFTKYIQLAKPIEMISCGKGFFVVGVRKVILIVTRPSGAINIVLTKVIHVPQISVNLLSVANLNRNNTKYRLVTGSYYFIDRTTKQIVCIGIQYGSL